MKARRITAVAVLFLILIMVLTAPALVVKIVFVTAFLIALSTLVLLAIAEMIGSDIYYIDDDGQSRYNPKDGSHDHL